MTEQELRKMVAKRICSLNIQVRSWEDLNTSEKEAWLGEAAQIINLLKENGWVSLHPDQELPENPIRTVFPLSRLTDILKAKGRGYDEAQQDMLKQVWRRVIVNEG